MTTHCPTPTPNGCQPIALRVASMACCCRNACPTDAGPSSFCVPPTPTPMPQHPMASPTMPPTMPPTPLSRHPPAHPPPKLKNVKNTPTRENDVKVTSHFGSRSLSHFFLFCDCAPSSLTWRVFSVLACSTQPASSSDLDVRWTWILGRKRGLALH